MRFWLSAVLVVGGWGNFSLSAQTTVTLATSANPAVFGHTLTLTATVSPSAANEKVTFYDGATVLGTSAVGSGKAVFSTPFLQPGSRSLKAYYAGDGTHSAASSPAFAEKVTTAVSNGFTASNVTTSVEGYEIAAGDFNGDGKADLFVAGYDGSVVLLGNGDGTFRAGSVLPLNLDYPNEIAVGDFNLDGKSDVVIAGGQSVTILLGNGDGTFGSPIQYPIGDYTTWLAIGDFNGDGKPDLAVTSNSGLWILLGNGDGTFQTAVSYPANTYQASMATGDFNGDGKTDLAITSGNGVDILLGNGNGSFQARVHYPSGAGTDLLPGNIVVGDFNADGKLDLAIGNYGTESGKTDSGIVGILLGNGDGTFQSPITTATINPTGIAVSDFNGDGQLDLAVCNFYDSTVSILLGKGDGTFGPTLNQYHGFITASMAVADFDGNGLADLALLGNSVAAVLLGSTNPSFGLNFTQSATLVQGQTGATYVLSVENVGFAGFAGQVQLSYTMGAGLTITNTQAPGWTCTTTSGGGTCTRADSLASGQSYPSITLTVNVSASALFQVVSNATLSFLSPKAPSVSASNTTTILQTQTITFPSIPNHTYGDPSFSINVSASSGLRVQVLSSGTCSVLGSVVNIDGAGTCTLTASQPGDLTWAAAVTITHTFSISGQPTSVWLNASAGSVQFGKPVTLTATITPPRTLDKVTFFDGVAILGIAPVTAGSATLTTSLLGPGNHSLHVYYGGITSSAVSVAVNALGVTSFVSPNQAPPSVIGQTLAVGDFNGEGRADVVIGNYNSPYLSVLLGNGDGTFRAAPHAYTGNEYFEPDFIAVGDFDGDGKSDLVLTYFSSDQFAILLGNGDGTFQTGVINNAYSKIQGAAQSVVIADFNGDGKADLAFLSYNTISIVLGNGDGTFGAPVDLAVLTNAWLGAPTLVAGDFNGDGKVDLAFVSETSSGVLLGNGDGTFQPVINSLVNGGTLNGSLVAADFNNDGKLDLAFAESDLVGVLLGNGDGTFRAEQDYQIITAISGNVFALLTSDLNQDQKPDVVVATSSDIIALPGIGNGTFAAPVYYPAAISGSFSFSGVSADFNGDGRPDLAVTSDAGNLSILLGSGGPVLSLSLTHTGNFAAGQTNATYSITVQNAGSNSTSGIVMVSGTFPWPLVIQSMAGNGWTCSVATVQCTRSDALAANASYPTITVTVSVATGPFIVGSQGTVSGGGSATTSVSDVTTIFASYLKFTTQPANGSVGTTLPAVVVQVQDSNGNVVSSSNVAVTLTSSPSGVNTTVAAVNGVATFSNLVLTTAGSYQLTALSNGLYIGTSNSFVISAATNTYTISGQATLAGSGLSGVTINVNGSQTTSTVTSASGYYSVALAQGGTYTLSAARSGYSFGAPLTFSNLSGNQTANLTGVNVPALEFFPVTPCRLVDTRVASFPSGFGPPSMMAGQTRTFTIPFNSSCGIPSTAAAYSLNVTVVTKGYLGILSIWPAGEAMPNVSTLNSYSSTSTAVANAAIVPAGANGAISVYVTDATELIIDINGYFLSATNGLEFFPVTPCRLVDTRVSSFQSGFGPPTMTDGATKSFTIPSNTACGIPSTAAAYSLNVTAVPQKTLGFLSIWPTGQPLPNVSTLNVYTTGTVVANAAIVPAGANGAISAYVTDATDLVIDINGYFAAGSNGLKLYPATPCRVADTRVASMPANLGPPSMTAGTQRSFPVPQSTCGIPSGAGAYSFNFTAVPHAPQLGIFITWPAGVAQPNVSTMNSYNGSVVANAAIVPASSAGAISIYVTDATDVLFDINGYFAP